MNDIKYSVCQHFDYGYEKTIKSGLTKEEAKKIEASLNNKNRQERCYVGYYIARETPYSIAEKIKNKIDMYKTKANRYKQNIKNFFKKNNSISKNSYGEKKVICTEENMDLELWDTGQTLCKCGGMIYREKGVCSCHINPPCGSCTTMYAVCDECGYEINYTA